VPVHETVTLPKLPVVLVGDRIFSVSSRLLRFLKHVHHPCKGI
jgi:hypothetical protein